MALTEKPSDWRFPALLPENGDLIRTLESDWTLTLDQPIQCGGIEYPFLTPLKITATACRTPEGAQITIALDGEVGTQCRRCGTELTVAIQDEFMYSYILRRSDAGACDEDEGEEYFAEDSVEIPVNYIGTSIDIADLVWECLVVSLPAYAECPEGCEAVEASTDDGIDPRLLAIADALKEEKQKGGK